MTTAHWSATNDHSPLPSMKTNPTCAASSAAGTQHKWGRSVRWLTDSVDAFLVTGKGPEERSPSSSIALAAEVKRPSTRFGHSTGVAGASGGLIRTAP